MNPDFLDLLREFADAEDQASARPQDLADVAALERLLRIKGSENE